MRSIIFGVAMLAGIGIGVFHNLGWSSDEPARIPDAAPGASPTAPRAIKENVVAYHTGDAKMNAAKQTGRSTLPRFRELIAAGTPGTYTVKFPLTQNGATEHIWLQLTDYRDGQFVGLLANKPVNGTKYAMGDEMTVAEADIEDWMIRSDDAIYGGYTARAALKDLPKEQADKYRALFRD
ncbi:MAG: DUF2314 domain-containing protein [Rhizobiaceae bacterium]|nr:DUF2314 domain-containing protein [Rhizobiaceae bacterium]